MATAIDVGPGATDRSSYYTNADRTWIALANPANATGTIDTVKIYPWVSNMESVRVGTFYGSGTTYTCRDYAYVGSVTGGTLRTVTSLSLAVESGDFLGIYFYTGSIEGGSGSGVYYVSGDQTESGAQTYTSAGSVDISIYATGIATSGTPIMMWG